MSLNTWVLSLAKTILKVLSLVKETKAYIALYSCICVVTIRSVREIKM